MKNQEQETKITKELLESTNYFNLKALLEKNDIIGVFKGGKSKAKIIKEAMAVYAKFETAKRLAAKVEVIESFTYTTDDDGNMIDENEIAKELSNEDIPLHVDKSEEAIDKPKRSIEEIEIHLAQVVRLATNGLETHRAHYSKLITVVQDELDEAMDKNAK